MTLQASEEVRQSGGFKSGGGNVTAEWFYVENGREKGPITAGQLKELAASGQLRPDDLIWKDGLKGWKPAGQLKGLFSQANVAADSPAGDPVIDLESVELVASSGSLGLHYQRLRNNTAHAARFWLGFGAVLLIASMFVPWWRMYVDFRARRQDFGVFLSATRKKDPGINGIEGLLANNNEVPQRDRERHFDRLADAARKKWLEDNNGRLESVVNDDRKWTVVKTQWKKFSLIFSRSIRATKNNISWYREHLNSSHQTFGERFSEFSTFFDVESETRESNAEQTPTIRLWGWSEGIAVMGLVFGVLVLTMTIVCGSVRVLKNWSWIVSCIAMIMGLITWILAVIWIVNAPGEDVGKYFVQGIIAGPYLLLGGGVIFFLTGLLDTVSGIKHLVRRVRVG